MANFLDVLAAAAKREFRAKAIRPANGDFWNGWFGALSSSGQNVSADNALKLATVWACVRLISTSVAGLPFSLYRRLPDGSREDARDHPVHDLIHNMPNADMAAMQFWQAVVASMLLWGNGYIRIHRNGSGRPIALEFLLPARMTLNCDSNGRLVYLYLPKGKDKVEIKRENIIHIPGLTLDGRVGLSSIAFGANVFGSAIAADQAASATFKNGLLPTIAFKIDRILNEEQRQEFKKYIATVSGAMNAGHSPVLEQGIGVERVGINPADAQLLESRSWSVEEICRWFGVPPWMIGHTDKGSNWGSGLEQQMIAFLVFVISAYTTQIQQSINAKLLTAVERQTFYSEFSLEGFLKADSKARAELYASASQNGWMTRNEIRRKENLPSVDGGDILTVQSNLMPLHSLATSNSAKE